MNDDILWWVVDSSADHGAIIFWWVGSCGIQPVLMPGNVYHWWLDDTTVLQATESHGGHRGRAN